MAFFPLLSFKMLNQLYSYNHFVLQESKCVPHYKFGLVNFMLTKVKNEPDKKARNLLFLVSFIVVPFFLLIDLCIYFCILASLLTQLFCFLIISVLLLCCAIIDGLNLLFFWLLCCYFCNKENMKYIRLENLKWKGIENPTSNVTKEPDVIVGN